MAAILKTRRPQCSYSNMLCDLLHQHVSIKVKHHTFWSRFVSRVNQTFVKYWNLDLRLMRAYTCLNFDFCVEDVY